jgi:hypothetical protein
VYSPNGRNWITEKSTEWKISRKKACGNTMVEMGSQNQYGLLVAAEYKRVEEVGRRQLTSGL